MDGSHGRRTWSSIVIVLSLLVGACAGGGDGAGRPVTSTGASATLVATTAARTSTSVDPAWSTSTTVAATTVATATSVADARRDRWTVLPQPPVRSESDVLAGDVVVIAGRTWERLGVEGPPPSRLYRHGVTADGAWDELPAPPVDALEVSLVVGLPGLVLASVVVRTDRPLEGTAPAAAPQPLWRLDLGSGAWTRTSVPPSTIVPWNAVVADDEVLFVWGTGDPIAGSLAYRPADDTWRTLAPAPVDVGALDWAWGDGQLFGWGPLQESGTVVADIGVVYDVRADQWQRLEAAPLLPRRDAGVVYTDDRLVVWGGSGASWTEDVAYADGTAYDPVRRTWTPMASGPLTAVRSPVIAGHYGDVLIFGGVPANPVGRDRVTMPPGPLAQAAVYDLRTRSWRTLADVPFAPVGPGGAPVRPVVQRLAWRPAAGADDAVVVVGGSIGPQSAEDAPGQLPPFVLWPATPA